MKEIVQRLQYLCEIIPPLLLKIDEHDFAAKPNPEKWSKKEIMGHLIDSATNNHHRIVRGQFEQKPEITYDNHTWNNGNHYRDIDGKHIVFFWTAYNKHLIEVIKHIPQHKLMNEVRTGEKGEKNTMTIVVLIQDYVEHLEYHLRQVVSYS